MARPQHDPPLESLARRHEVTGVSIRALMWFFGAFIAVAVVLHAGLWFLLLHFAHEPRAVDAPRSIVAGAPAPLDAPPLQPTPAHDRLPYQDLQQMYAREDAVFAALGWSVDPATHAAAIPEALLRRLTPPTTRPGGF